MFQTLIFAAKLITQANMSGLYIHIPFCRKACSYCNFHFSTSLSLQSKMLEAIHEEMAIKKNFLKENALSTIYIGGGTPSILSLVAIEKLINSASKHCDTSSVKEITLELNPDDASPAYLKGLHDLGINRLSIGIQSFSDEDLTLMNRAHNSAQAKDCLQWATDIGYDISADLIYGTPSLSEATWLENIQTLLSYSIDHISAYQLTIEPKTPLEYQVKQKKIIPITDEKFEKQFDILIKTLGDHNFKQYEISNFAKNKKYALHNTNYWRGKEYLGIGPSAHSFFGNKRQWNTANNALYIQQINANLPCFEEEALQMKDQFNEMIMTRLRTMWGISPTDLFPFPTELNNHLRNEISKWIASNHILINDNDYILSQKGKMIADAIISDLFYL